MSSPATESRRGDRQAGAPRGSPAGAPRIEIDLAKIGHNARTLVAQLGARGIGVTGVTKAGLGSVDIAHELLAAGVRGLGDSRIENLEVLRRDNATARLALIRTPMLSQVDRVVAHADVSLNSELTVLEGLAHAAREQGTTHAVVLMVELGDLREGILPGDLPDAVRATLRLQGVALVGIGTNLACRSGVVPDAAKMTELSALATAVEAAFDLHLEVVSGGNSANLTWALGADDVGRVNDLRLGEAILLGREPLYRQPLPDLHLDAFTLVAEVIEAKVKPSLPWGTMAEAAFGVTEAAVDRGLVPQAILAIGEQDVDPRGVEAPGVTILGASSDHLVITSDELLPVGSEVRFRPNYSALLRAMTSPFVVKDVTAAVGSLPPADPVKLPAA